METIRKWTTPTQQLIVPDIDLSDKEVFVTFAQGTNATTFSGTDITVEYVEPDTVITVPLTQTTTGGFNGVIAVQVNYMDGGERHATDIAYIKATPNLVDEEIT